MDDLATGNINCCWKGCQEDLLDLQSFQTHLAEHTHPFLCSKCFLRLRNPKELNTHRCKKLVCDKCLQLFDTVLQLKDHINQDHSNLCKVLSCFECTKPFATLVRFSKRAKSYSFLHVNFCSNYWTCDRSHRKDMSNTRIAKKLVDSPFLPEINHPLTKMSTWSMFANFVVLHTLT